MRIPSCDPRPVPTSSAVGVARPRAHGHATIRVAMAAVKAASIDPSSMSQPTKVSAASPKTIGTKTADTRSASRWASAFPVWASSTSRPRRASSVSDPMRVTSMTSRPPTFTVAPTTRSPTATSTGTDSPVSMLRSTAEAPSTTRPSVAIFSPGRVMNWSPIASVDTATRVSTPLANRIASFAPSSSKARSAAPDSRLARASTNRPARRKMVTALATSR